jgi:hypothetical protein
MDDDFMKDGSAECCPERGVRVSNSGSVAGQYVDAQGGFFKGGPCSLSSNYTGMFAV